MSPFEVMHGYKPCKPIDLISLPLDVRIFKSAEEFALHVQNLHESIHKQINLSNETYKLLADSHKCHQEF